MSKCLPLTRIPGVKSGGGGFMISALIAAAAALFIHPYVKIGSGNSFRALRSRG